MLDLHLLALPNRRLWGRTVVCRGAAAATVPTTGAAGSPEPAGLVAQPAATGGSTFSGEAGPRLGPYVRLGDVLGDDGRRPWCEMFWQLELTWL